MTAAQRLVSAAELIVALRGRKTSGEVTRVRAAVETTRRIYERTFDYLRPGLTEIQIRDFMHAQLQEFGVGPAWNLGHCPTVNAGPDSLVGHVGALELAVARGQIVHFDFGVRQDGYCSDIQRVVYMTAPGERKAPQAVQRAFETIARAIQAAAAAMRPGVLGQEVDAVLKGGCVCRFWGDFFPSSHPIGRR